MEVTIAILIFVQFPLCTHSLTHSHIDIHHVKYAPIETFALIGFLFRLQSNEKHFSLQSAAIFFSYAHNYKFMKFTNQFRTKRKIHSQTYTQLNEKSIKKKNQQQHTYASFNGSTVGLKLCAICKQQLASHNNTTLYRYTML